MASNWSLLHLLLKLFLSNLKHRSRIIMNSLLALKGDGFLAIATDKSKYFYNIKINNDYDKCYRFGSHIVICPYGESGFGEEFINLLKSNFSLHELRHGKPMSLTALANFAKNIMMDRLRSREGMVKSNFLLGGFCTYSQKAMAFSLDPYGTLIENNALAAGDLKSYFLSLCGLVDDDRLFTKEEVYEIFDKYSKIVNKNYVAHNGDLRIYVTDKEGTRNID
ncbi:MAG: Proteasome subunit beta type-2 [Marteilia pararefringens]